MKSKQFILATVLGATAFSAWADDSYQHIRNATAKVEYAGQTFLIDPFFAPKHSMNGFAGTFNNQAKMPLVGLPMSVNKIWGCTRLADMLPSKYEDNTLQIKEESTERTAPLFCTRSYRPFCRRYFGYPSQFGSPVLPQNPYGHQPSFGLGCR